MENGLTLEELSKQTGVEQRTLRSWVSEGLLAPPLKAGRGAKYPNDNADRVLAIRVLKDIHGLSLAEIGKRFMFANPDEIRSWAREAVGTHSRTGSVRDYLNKVRSPGSVAERSIPREKPPVFSSSARRQSSRSEYGEGTPLLQESEKQQLGNVERLIHQLAGLLNLPAPRRSRGISWVRISVTADLEISVRGDFKPHERVLFEQLADQLRAILMGRINP